MILYPQSGVIAQTLMDTLLIFSKLGIVRNWMAAGWMIRTIDPYQKLSVPFFIKGAEEEGARRGGERRRPRGRRPRSRRRTWSRSRRDEERVTPIDCQLTDRPHSSSTLGWWIYRVTKLVSFNTICPVRMRSTSFSGQMLCRFKTCLFIYCLWLHLN